MTKQKKILSITFLSVLTCIFTLFVSSFAANNNILGTTKVIQSTGYRESGVGVGKFEVLGVDGKTHKAYCATHERKLPSVGTTMSTTVCTNQNLRKMLYYGYGGPASKGYNYAQTSLAISVANGHYDTDYTGELNYALGKPVYNELSKLAAPGNDFIVYYATSADTNTQDLIYYVYQPEGKVVIKKESKDAEITNNNSEYSLAGAVYGIYNDKDCTNQIGTLTTDENGTSNSISLKSGTYYIKEITAPKGYLLNDKIESTVVESGKTSTVEVADTPDTTVIPDFLFSKIVDDPLINDEEENRVPVSDAIFTITSKRTGEELLTMTTDKNGYITYETTEETKIPFDTYVITETKTPSGYIKAPSFEFTINKENLVENGAVIKDKLALGQINLEKVDEKTGEVVVGATYEIVAAEDITTPDGTVKVKKDTVVDTITTGNDGRVTSKLLYLGKYTVKEVSAPNGYVLDDKSYDVDIQYKDDTTEVVEETLKLTNSEAVIIGTSAKDKDSNCNIANTNEKTTIIDTVSYKDILSNKEYTIKGILMNKKTGEPLLIDNKEITGETTFTPTENEGSVDVEFTFNSTTLKDVDIVVFETLYYKDIEITEHKDINDEGQTISFKVPSIQTKVDKNTVDPSNDTKIKDTISYDGLIPGREYTVSGKVMDKSTGKSLTIDNKEITATGKFIPENTKGTTEVEFTIDTSSLAGKTFVVFEKVYYGETEIASHEDINDQNQSFTVNKPTVNTPITTQTGDTNLPFIILFSCVFVLGLLYIVKRFKK